MTSLENDNIAHSLSERSDSSVYSRFSTISRECNKFSGCMAQIEALEESGKSLEDQLKDAMELFRSLQKKPFKFMVCWDILKMSAKWGQYLDRQATTPSTAQRNKRNRPLPASNDNDGSTSSSANNPNSARDEGRSEGGTRAAKYKRQQMAIMESKVKITKNLAEIMKQSNITSVKAMQDRTNMLLMMQDPDCEEAQTYLQLKRKMALMELQKEINELQKQADEAKQAEESKEAEVANVIERAEGIDMVEDIDEAGEQA